MFLAPEGEEIEIADAAAGYLAEAMPIERLHASSSADMGDAMRRSLAEMGWFALAVPEADGGSGLSAVEHALFFREVGRRCGPVDVLAQSLAAIAVDDPGVRARLVSGEAGVAIAVADGAGLRLIGAGDAAYALQVGPEDARLLALADVEASPRPSLDPANTLRIVAGPIAPLSVCEGGRIWAMGQLGAAAMLVGLAEGALDLINEYAKVRETFGRKIGSYQAVRHPIANMALAAEVARCQLWYAAAALREGRTDAGVHLDAAKHLANQAAIGNADTCIQLHGGIGVTDEHDAHLFLKHALLLGKLFGTKRALLGRLVDARIEA